VRQNCAFSIALPNRLRSRSLTSELVTSHVQQAETPGGLPLFQT